MFATLLAILMMYLDDSPAGSIRGVVVNGTHRGEPVADAVVNLRAGPKGLLDTVATAKTDIYGKFSFSDVPLDPAIVYLPGANCDGVHYPGQRMQLDQNNRTAYVKIVIFDAVASPSPLKAARHDVDIEVEEHALEITETLVVSNPSRKTFVGHSTGDSAPVTLQLSVPEYFDRVTFENEFYGRRFRILDRCLVTDTPWPPGDVRLSFTYRVPLEKTAGLFRRPLDLPSSNLRIRVRQSDRQHVSCNLSSPTSEGEYTVFARADHSLPIGYTIELQFGNLPTPWTQYARWGALAALGTLVFGTHFLSRRKRLAMLSHAADVLGVPCRSRFKPSQRAA